MLTFNNWIKEKRHFSLAFIDLDNLKYINDIHGHEEGDVYIIKTAIHLKNVPGDNMACRVGGDEFMLLMNNANEDEAHQKMVHIQRLLSSEEYTKDKDYTYNISYGIVEVSKSNKNPASVILNMADEKMYTHKRVRKKARFFAQQQQE
jgi:diguanylate cyclase (GGDEF)-like protein